MRHGVFVNKFLVADFPDGRRSDAIQEAYRRDGEFFDFRTGESLWPKNAERRRAALLKKAQELSSSQESS
jgi:hypothetical protein